MTGSPGAAASVYAISDLHVGYAENLALVEEALHPTSPDDWLVVAGDVAEVAAQVRQALELLAGRFARVLWTPGNHELWTPRDDPDQRRGQERYDHLVAVCRSLGVLTPEDPYARWDGPGGPVLVAPLFVPYDYSWHAPGTHTKAESLAYAHRTGIVCADEDLLDPAPFPGMDAWCDERVRVTEERLAACGRDVPLVLVNHFPLVREPTHVLRHPEFAQWCGTVRTTDWHRRYPVEAVVYGHLHIPRTTHHDGVRFEEVSLGYPRERRAHPRPGPLLRRIVPPPVPGAPGGGS